MTRSSSTTRPSATACRARGCRCPPRRSCASRTGSTSSASHLIEAGFPASNPKELELFELLARRDVRARRDRRLRHDAPPRRDAPTRTRRCACWPTASRRSCTLVGKTWALHLEKVVKRRPRGEPAHDRRVRRVPRRAGQARRLRRRALLRRLARRPRLRAALPARGGRGGRRDGRACATRTAPRCRARSPRRSPTSSPQLADTASRVGIHTHNDAECGVANSLAAVEAGATHVQGTMNGYGERCGNANLVSIIPNLQLKLGYECLPPDRLAAHRDRALRRRAAQPHAGRRPAVRRQERLRAQGRHARRRRARRPATFEHIDPALVGNRRELLISELSGKGTVLARAEQAGLELDDAAARARDRARQGARARRLPLRGRRRLVRAAAAQGDRRATSRCSGSSPGA